VGSTCSPFSCSSARPRVRAASHLSVSVPCTPSLTLAVACMPCVASRRPILGVEAILVSVLSMLSDPNFESPANIDASVELRNDPKAYRAKIRKLVRDSMDAL